MTVMAVDVTRAVREAVARLPEGATLTVETLFDALCRFRDGAFEKFTGRALREQIEGALDVLEREAGIHLAQVATHREPAVYRVHKELTKLSQGVVRFSNTEPQQIEPFADSKPDKQPKGNNMIDFNKVEELAAQGVSISQVGVKLGMSDGYGSYQAKHNPDFLAAFNRGRARAKLAPFQARKSPSTNGRKNVKAAGARTKAKTNGRAVRNSLSELPPPANGIPNNRAVSESYAQVIADLRRQQQETEQLIQFLESRCGA